MAWTIQQMCKKIAELELHDGYYVNLGIGIPTQISNYIPKNVRITLQSENGMLGIGPFPTRNQVDPDLINAGKQTVTELSHSSYFNSAESFAMIRGGHIDVAILGAFEVSQSGDLANWMIPDRVMNGMGGAMDLVAGVKRIVVIMEHTSKKGQPKLRRHCTLPLTGHQVVDRVITNLGIFDIKSQKTYLTEKAPGVSVEEIQDTTEAKFFTALDRKIA